MHLITSHICCSGQYTVVDFTFKKYNDLSATTWITYMIHEFKVNIVTFGKAVREFLGMTMFVSECG